MKQHTGLGSTSGQVMEHVQVQRRSLSEMRRTRREGAGVGGCLMFVHHTAYFEASGLLRLRTTAVLAHVLRSGGSFKRNFPLLCNKHAIVWRFFFGQILAFKTASIVTTVPTIESSTGCGGRGGGGGRRNAEGHKPCITRSIPSVCSSADASVITGSFSPCTCAARVTTPSTPCSTNRTMPGDISPPTGRC